MNYIESVKDLRKLIKGGDIVNENLAARLEENGCLYLMMNIPSKRKIALKTAIANSEVIRNRYMLCKTLFKKMECIPYALIKGAVLSKKIYGDPMYRISGDLDLLISPNSLELVKDILEDQGYVQGYIKEQQIVPYSREELIFQKIYSHQLAPFVKATRNGMCPYIKIDINLNVLWGESDLYLSIDELLTHTESDDLMGINIRRLVPEYEFISLCLHHYKDFNSIYLLCDRGIDLSAFIDLYFYLRNVKIDVTNMYLEAKKYGVDKYICYCIYFTYELFGDGFLGEILNMFIDSYDEELIMGYGLTNKERHKWEIPFYERVFNNNFQTIFEQTLKNDAINKVAINRRYM